MSEVVTFVDYRPPARYDELPWTHAQIQEAATFDGAFVTLETQPLSPLDTDPAHPMYRSFTTELGTASNYWYRLVFTDATGDTSQPTTPIQNTAAGGAAVAVRAYADVDELARVLRLRSPTAAQQTAMQRVLDAAAFEIDREIGLLDPYDQPPALAVEVNIERAVEHWQQEESPFGVIGLGDQVPTVTSKDSWDRHAFKLAPLKQTWGIG